MILLLDLADQEIMEESGAKPYRVVEIDGVQDILLITQSLIVYFLERSLSCGCAGYCSSRDDPGRQPGSGGSSSCLSASVSGLCEGKDNPE